MRASGEADAVFLKPVPQTRLRNPPSRDGRFSSELRFMLLRRGPLWPYPPFKYPNEGAHRKQSGLPLPNLRYLRYRVPNVH